MNLRLKTFYLISAIVFSQFITPCDLFGQSPVDWVMLGGPEAAARKLNEQFEASVEDNFLAKGSSHGNALIDYANQDGTGAAHYFNRIGYPWLSQKWVRAVQSAAFSGTDPQSGYNGDRILQPAARWEKYQNVECPQFYPLFPFNRFDLFGKDSDHLQVFRNTWKHGSFPKNMVISWHQDGIFFARMGMTEDAKQYNVRKLDDSPRRFPTFWGPGHDWVPDHNWGGSGMLGLQEMLMQTIGDEIRLLPAWPKDWDVDFQLHAPHKTTVKGKVRSGRVVELKVTPKSRKADVRIVDS